MKSEAASTGTIGMIGSGRSASCGTRQPVDKARQPERFGDHNPVGPGENHGPDKIRTQRATSLSSSDCVSVAFFIPFLLSERLNLSFWQAYAFGCLVLPLGFLVHRVIARLVMWAGRPARCGIFIADGPPEVSMADDQQDEMEVVPLPSSESEAEHQRIRSSNDRDQKLEREGKVSRHNRGYDEAADGAQPTPEVERVVDED
jgi:hypothetical protein